MLLLVLYRGCADAVSWPQLDIGYNGCRYQSYGSWGKKPVVWCFCNFDLCNINISYVTLKFPGASDSGIVTEIIRGQGQGQGQGQNHGSGLWDILTREKLHGGGGGGRDSNVDSGGRSQGGKGKEGSVWHWGIENVPSNPDGAGVLPQPPNIYPPEKFPPYDGLPPWNKFPPSWRPGIGGKSIDDWKIIEKYLKWIQGIGKANPTQQQPPRFTPSDGHPYSTSPGPPPNRGPLYNIPDELLRYLLENLPKDANEVRSIPYPVYVILYLLVSSGVDVSSVAGLNLTADGFTVPPGWPWNLGPHKGNYPMYPGDSLLMLHLVCGCIFL